MLGQFVVLVNPKNSKQKVASGKINGRWRLEKFHGAFILEFWFKVDLQEAYVHGHPLMHPHEANDQAFVRDVVCTCTLWN